MKKVGGESGLLWLRKEVVMKQVNGGKTQREREIDYDFYQ